MDHVKVRLSMPCVKVQQGDIADDCGPDVRTAHAGTLAPAGRKTKSRFEKDCLAEYAEVFKSVCVDAVYNKFPEQRYLEGMVDGNRLIECLTQTNRDTARKCDTVGFNRRFGQRAAQYRGEWSLFQRLWEAGFVAISMSCRITSTCPSTKSMVNP
jgi:hypothetical protein